MNSFDHERIDSLESLVAEMLKNMIKISERVDNLNGATGLVIKSGLVHNEWMADMDDRVAAIEERGRKAQLLWSKN